MSAIGRLWRRAPAWRLCLIAAAGTTALAAMFPPPMPHWPRHGGRSTPATAPGAGATAAHFTPEAASGAANVGGLEITPDGPGRSGIIAFAGHHLPLPAGQWQELLVGRAPGTGSAELALFARVESGQLTGLILPQGSNPVGQDATPATALEACFKPGTLLREITPETPDQSPFLHECWTLARVALNDRAKLVGDVFEVALKRLDRLGATIPPSMMTVFYLRSTPLSWMTVLLLLPDHGANPAQFRRLESWARRYVAELHKGFDGKLTPGGPAASLARDPG